MTETMHDVIIHTDGACKGNPGPGGWGALLAWGDHEKELYGGEAHTTNNRMELTAALALVAFNLLISATAVRDRVAADASEWDPCDDPSPDAAPFTGEL